MVIRARNKTVRHLRCTVGMCGGMRASFHIEFAAIDSECRSSCCDANSATQDAKDPRRRCSKLGGLSPLSAAWISVGHFVRIYNKTPEAAGFPGDRGDGRNIMPIM